MMIDPSTANLIPDNDKNEEQVFLTENINSYNLKPLSEKKHSAMMYLNTLSPFSAYSSGEYIMTALKKTTGTENFLNIPDDERKCHLETFEQCQNKRFLEEVVSRCGCLPWALNNALTPKVNRVIAVSILYFGFLKLPPRMSSSAPLLPLPASHQSPPATPTAAGCHVLDFILTSTSQRTNFW